MSLNGAGNILIADMGATHSARPPPQESSHHRRYAHPAGSATVPHRRHASNYLQCSLPMPLEIFNVGDSNGIREVTTTGQVSTPFSGRRRFRFWPPRQGYFYFTRFFRMIRFSVSRQTVRCLSSRALSMPGSRMGTGRGRPGFNQPHGLAVRLIGHLIVADTGNATIRMITPAAS